MTDLEQQFQTAVAESKQLPEKPSNEVLLQLYSLYKQSTEGDATEDAAPTNAFDFVAKAKYNAWEGQKGKSKEDAMKEYVQLIEKLK
jgi:diazepam-binding inhibitor (GABA receptor modulator, acyl-CoA-binding protein)